MAIRKEKEEIRAEGSSKRKKVGILSLIMCLLIAFIIWCYAEAQVKKEELEVGKGNNSQYEQTSGNGQGAE